MIIANEHLEKYNPVNREQNFEHITLANRLETILTLANRSEGYYLRSANIANNNFKNNRELIMRQRRNKEIISAHRDEPWNEYKLSYFCKPPAEFL